jgi:hypothetical protein
MEKRPRRKEKTSEREREREGGRERSRGEGERGEETERDGDLGSAYRSGRVTCVPEVGVLAWTNRRATPLSLSLSASPLLSPFPSASLVPLAHPRCRSSFHSLPLTSISTRTSPHAGWQTRTHTRAHARMHARHHCQYARIPACLITSVDNAMRPFRYNEMADDRCGHIADIEKSADRSRAPLI